MKKIAFVCSGNTCRSPMAECIFKHFCYINKVKKIKVSSFGLTARSGEEINPLAKKMLTDNKIRYKSHKSKKLTDRQIKSQNYVFVMTFDQKRILKRYPNVYTISEFVDGVEVPDPYGLGEIEYNAVFKILYVSVKRLFDKLKQNKFFEFE